MPVPSNEPENTPAPTTRAEVLPPESESTHSSSGTTSPLANGLENGDGPSRPNKMFVGGLSWHTTEDTLREFFEEFGEVMECNIMKDPVSRRSRGFGFVTFKDPDSVDKVLETHLEDPLCIDEKNIDPKIAVPQKRLNNKVKRIFVGGLSSDSTEDDLREYFEQFGKVLESQLMYDRNTNRHRGFGFITFDTEEPAEKVCSIQYHDIKGKKVEVKVAQTKEALALQGRGRMFAARGYAAYGYPAPTYTPFYPAHYPLDVMVGGMGGYTAAQMMTGGAGGRPRGKGRSFPQYHTPYAFAPGFVDHHRINLGGYYPPSYGGMLPPQLMRGPPTMDHSGMGPGSGMDYLSNQFQGMTISAAYPAPAFSNAPPSPVGQYTTISPAMGMVDPAISTAYSSNGNHFAHTTIGGSSYSPTHSLSPKGVPTSASVNGFTTQVPTYTYTGSQAPYPVAQASY